MTLTIKIDLDNDAFGSDCFSRTQEVKRILSEISFRLIDGEWSEEFLFDYNGNRCGFYGVDL